MYAIRSYDDSLNNRKKLQESKDTKKAEAIYKKIANIDTTVPIFNVADIMTLDVITLSEENSLQEAYNIMIENDINQIPIISSETNQVTAMVTYKMILDILMNDIDYVQFNS